MSRTPIKVQLDTAVPVDFGAQVQHALASPALAHGERSYRQQQVAQMWTGFLSAAVGAMAASCGPDTVEAVLDTIRPLAREVWADLAAERKANTH